MAYRPQRVARHALILATACGIGTLLELGNFAVGSEPSESSAESTAAAVVRMRDSVKLLASDEFDGRGVGTEGIDQAAEYLATQFREMGLNTELFDDDGPFQKFSVTSKTELGAAENNQLALAMPDDDGEIKQVELELGDEFSPLALGTSGAFDAEVVFVGYGITAEDIGYDDYADVDVEGKVVLILRKEPQQDDAQSPFAGRRSSPHATFQAKIDNAAEHNVAAVILINDAVELEKSEKSLRRKLDAAMKKLTSTHEKYAEKEEPDVSDEKDYLRQIARQSKIITEAVAGLRDKEFDRVLGLKEAGSRNRAEIPVFFAARDVIEPMIQQALDTDLAALERAIDEELSPCSAPLANCSARGRAEIVVQNWEVKNVLGVLEGDGPLADETIIIGAHYDHLGSGGAGSLAPWTVDIHNGADDNASGTATLLELARRFATRDEKPKRRLVFMAFTGEERGLLGSAHYVRNPRFPLEDTIAMINLDMVGRLTDNQLTLYGTGTAKEFDPLVERLNETYQFDITKKPGGYGPSDHASFYPKKIPVLFFFTGLHRDYHRPSDDWDKLNYDGMARIADMATETITAIDSAEERPKYLKKSRLKSLLGRFADRGDPDSNEDTERAYLGVAPDPQSQGEGFVIGQVVADSPADTAGLETGDEIIRVGKRKVQGLAAIGRALSEQKPGDNVNIVILRDGEEKTIEVELGTAP